MKKAGMLGYKPDPTQDFEVLRQQSNNIGDDLSLYLTPTLVRAHSSGAEHHIETVTFPIRPILDANMNVNGDDDYNDDIPPPLVLTRQSCYPVCHDLWDDSNPDGDSGNGK